MPTIPELAIAAGSEVARATAGHKAPSVESIQPPAFMRMAPTIDVGAYYHAAYWLAVASRIAQAQGQQGSFDLTRTAVWYLTQANAYAGPAGSITGAGRGSSNVIPTLQGAAALADRSGIPDVAHILRGQGTPSAIQAAVAIKQETSGGSWFDLSAWLPDLRHRFRNLAVVVGGSIVLLGAASYMFGRATRPYGTRRVNGRRRNGVIGSTAKRAVRGAFFPLGVKLTKILWTIGVTVGVGAMSGPAAPAVMAVALPTTYLAVNALDKATKPGRR